MQWETGKISKIDFFRTLEIKKRLAAIQSAYLIKWAESQEKQQHLLHFNLRILISLPQLYKSLKNQHAMAKPGSLSATGGGRTGSFKTPFPKNYLPLLFDRLVVHWRISHKITKPLRIYQDGINKYAPSDRVPKYTKTNKMEGRNKTIQIIIGFQYFVFKNGLNN